MSDSVDDRAGLSLAQFTQLDPGVARELPRHRHALSRDQVRTSQHSRLILATVQVVAEKGYAGASVRQIATRAGISTKTFYELYPDKEEAFLATYAAVDRLTELMRHAAAQARTAAGVIEAGLTAYLTALAAEPAFTQSLVVEVLASTDRIRARRAQGLADFAAAMIEGLRRVRAGHGPDPAPSPGAHALLIGALGA
ncbi:TetR/AcrR family transcriptional regulator [Nocardia africana]|uniref:DNA-binding transcriptional repressor FabR n=1 Tax=Nocardia africana TaxID=134964 RepID=A0A378WV07_9NOCA|nr:TetR/AcrR family transcriptional regulator [Nocardia africana]SUA44999.1 DNA-binding transcriptional repressor FabR [Nocardia africana]